jgi:hypothetical protein
MPAATKLSGIASSPRAHPDEIRPRTNGENMQPDRRLTVEATVQL